MSDDAFTLTSYNIRKAIGRDGKRNPERIVEVLNTTAADIVILHVNRRVKRVHVAA